MGSRSESTPAGAFAALWARVIEGPGVTPRSRREAAAAATGHGDWPAVAGPVLERIRTHAYRVTDDDLRALREAGLSEDDIFELTVAAATGVAARRRQHAFAAIQSAKGTP